LSDLRFSPRPWSTPRNEGKGRKKERTAETPITPGSKILAKALPSSGRGHGRKRRGGRKVLKSSRDTSRRGEGRGKKWEGGEEERGHRLIPTVKVRLLFSPLYPLYPDLDVSTGREKKEREKKRGKGEDEGEMSHPSATSILIVWKPPCSFVGGKKKGKEKRGGDSPPKPTASAVITSFFPSPPHLLSILCP